MIASDRVRVRMAIILPHALSVLPDFDGRYRITQRQFGLFGSAEEDSEAK
jgi:hypothetical protein